MTHWDEVKARFERQQQRGRFPGGQLVVRHRGQQVLNCATGVARGFRASEGEATVPVTPATRFAVFSASKPVVAVAIAMLEEKGVIDVSSPVAKYWPEFAANGKAELTVLDALTHRAGVFIPTPPRWGDEAAIREALVQARPRWPRGTLAYMPYEFGWILAEVVRGATGRRLDEFIKTELTKENPGLRFGATADELPSLAKTYWLSKGAVKVAGSDLAPTFERDNNDPDMLTSFIPAAGLVCTAADLALFYESLASGKFISRETLQRYTQGPTAYDRSNGLPLRMARGFLLGAVTPSIYGWWNTQHVFGHAGAFCTLAWADPARELSAAIVTNGNRGPYESLFRFAALGSAIRSRSGLTASR